MSDNEKRKVGKISIEGAVLRYRNFQGRKTDFNDEGNRNFCVVLNDDLAEQLTEDGWNVKWREAKHPERGEEGFHYLPVKVKYGKIPPIANLITSRGKTRLTEETIGQLDWARIKNVDLKIRPYVYPETPMRPSGIAAYLESIWVTILEDELELKYANIPDADAVTNDLPFDDDNE